MVDPLWESAKMGLGSVLDNLQLNNSLTHSNFRLILRLTNTAAPNPRWKRGPC